MKSYAQNLYPKLSSHQARRRTNCYLSGGATFLSSEPPIPLPHLHSLFLAAEYNKWKPLPVPSLGYPLSAHMLSLDSLLVPCGLKNL